MKTRTAKIKSIPILLVLALGGVSMTLPACSSNDGSRVEEAMEEVQDEAEDAAENLEDEIDDRT